MLIAASFTIAKIWKQPKCSSIEKWIALTGVAQLVGYHPAKQRVTGSIPGQIHNLCCGFSPSQGTYER